MNQSHVKPRDRVLEQMRETLVSTQVQDVRKRKGTGGAWDVGSKGSLPIYIREGLELLPSPLYPNTIERGSILGRGTVKEGGQKEQYFWVGIMRSSLHTCYNLC